MNLTDDEMWTAACNLVHLRERLRRKLRSLDRAFTETQKEAALVQIELWKRTHRFPDAQAFSYSPGKITIVLAPKR